MIELYVNGVAYQAREEDTVLRVLQREGFDIPTLCYHEALKPFGACRLCLVEVVSGGRSGITASCALPVSQGLSIKLDTPDIVRARKMLLEMYLAEAPQSQQINELAEKYGVTRTRFVHADTSASGSRCVLCGRCVRVCNELLGLGAINYTGRGVSTSISTPWHEASDVCIGCGACAYVCPTGAIEITDLPDLRIMETWQRTALIIRNCKETKQGIATEKGIDLLYKLLPDLPVYLGELSAEARRTFIATGMKLLNRT